MPPAILFRTVRLFAHEFQPFSHRRSHTCRCEAYACHSEVVGRLGGRSVRSRTCITHHPALASLLGLDRKLAQPGILRSCAVGRRTGMRSVSSAIACGQCSGGPLGAKAFRQRRILRLSWRVVFDCGPIILDGAVLLEPFRFAARPARPSASGRACAPISSAER